MPAFAVFVNDAAGSSTAERISLVRELIEGAGSSITLESISEPKLEERIRAAMQRGDIVVAGGGDGTVSCVAQSVVGSKSAFGVLPLGTLNHFSKDLGVGPTLQEAVTVLLSGNIREIDTGRVNDKIFLNNSSLGMYTKLVTYRERLQKKGIGKWFAFVGALVYIIRRYHRVEVELEVEGRLLCRKTPLLFAGNNEYELEGWEIGSRKTLDGGVLQLAITKANGPFEFLISAFRTLLASSRRPVNPTGQSRRAQSFIDLYLTESFVIGSSSSKQPTGKTITGTTTEVSTDGEVHQMNLPLHFSINPKSLYVLAPRMVDHPRAV